MREVVAVRSYEATASIDAGPEEVWRVLVDGRRWPSWDSGVLAVEGTFTPGGKVAIRSEVSPGRAFPVRVAEVAEPNRLVLVGGMPLGLFRGVRTYTLTPEGAGTAFRVREEFTGPLLPLVGRSMPDLQPSFDRFAEGLRKRVESGA